MNNHIELPEVTNIKWIENLAMEEINMEESGVITMRDHLNPHHVLDEASIELMDEIRDRAEVYISKFNQYRSEAHNSIRVFKISNTINDFMLFRNSLKLIFARKNPGTISIGFLSNSGGLYAARTNDKDPAINQTHELIAKMGPFNNIIWTFEGERVDVEALLRHYITEFIKLSAR